MTVGRTNNIFRIDNGQRDFVSIGLLSDNKEEYSLVSETIFQLLETVKESHELLNWSYVCDAHDVLESNEEDGKSIICGRWNTTSKYPSKEKTTFWTPSIGGVFKKISHLDVPNGSKVAFTVKAVKTFVQNRILTVSLDIGHEILLIESGPKPKKFDLSSKFLRA